MKFIRLLLALSLSNGLVLPSLLLAAESKPQKKGAVGTQLVSDAAAIAPGQPFTVALRMQHDPHWHSYWIAAGTGYPTSLAWTLPEGFKAGPIQWPAPHMVKDTAGTITGNGYEGESFLLVEITPPATLAPGATVKLTAAAEWLMCMDVCMPGDASLEISFPVAADTATDAKWTQAIADARAKLPVASTGWAVTASHDDQSATLRLTPKPGTTHQPADLHFFAADAFTDYTKTNTVTRAGDTWVITGPLDAAADKGTKRLTGVLVSSNGWSAGSGYAGLAIDVPFQVERVVPDAPPSIPGSQPSAGSPPPAPSSLLATLALAFLGGLILNLMPCVFPVLGIKVLGFVNQSGSAKAKIVSHGLVFALGVLVSFWALAGVLLALRAGGSQLGWGFQLQSPAFVFGMAVFLLIFALNLSGLFEIGLSATGVGGNLQMQEGYAGSFFTGALATLVATPCSAPFLAPALGAALSLSAGQSFLVFTCIAIGLALPYLLLSIFPQAVRLLPRPGAWMETFKQFMAFPLYATVGWLLWVLAGQTKDDDNALLMISFGFVIVAMAAWSYGRFGQPHGKPGKQLFGRVFAAALLAGGLYTGWPKTAEIAPAGSYQVTWEKWSPEAIAAAQAAGKFVYVDFTARWCATCQTNKATVFHNDAVLAELKKKDVVLLRGDWTNRDPKITAELARWNRSAVPFNLIYAPGKPEPVILPELLTGGVVLEAFAKAAR
ncbi:MAG: protein-disulfide reductase DsbD family protein [Lacunisphaera sp.]|nr:protein-disulfide reductase DsbD family protein [Lacunisphaera sp.]